MPSFSHSSWEKLAAVHEDLQKVFIKVVETFDCTILEGLRTPERQAQLVAENKSKTLHSKHLTGRAVDVAPYPIDFHDTERFYLFAGYVLGVAQMLGIRLRWGGDWDSDWNVQEETFKDLVHWELV